MKVEKFAELIKVSDVKEKDKTQELLNTNKNVEDKLKDNSVEEELIEVSPDLDDDEIDLSEESIKGMLDEIDVMEKDGELNDDMKKAKQVLSVLSELSSKNKIKESVDINSDGTISSDEIKEFLKETAKIDGNKNSVSLADVTHKLEAMGFKIDDKGHVVNKDEVKDSASSKSLLDNVSDNAQNTSASYPVDNSVGSVGGGGYSSGAGGVGGSGYSSGVGGGGGSYTPYSSSGSVGNLGDFGGISNTQSLEEEKKQIESEISTKKEELASARSGEHSEVKAAVDEETKAKEAMDKAIEEDEKVSEELKEKLDNKIDEVDKKEDEIDEKNSKIDETKNSISECESSISTLESALSFLPAPSGKEEDKEKDAKIAERKSELEGQIKEKKAELDKLNSELKTLEDELKTLEDELKTLNDEKKEIEDEIKENCGEETKKAIEAYEKAKQNVETVKEKVVSSIQGEIDSLQVKLSEVNQKIEENKNKKAQGGSAEDILELALQFAGKSQAEMQKIMQEKGYPFHSGAWCADFVNFIISEVMGEDMPSWYANCANRSYCPTVENAGKSAGACVPISEAKPGDLVIFDWNGGVPDHIGIVVSVNPDGSLNTIEGNTSGSSCQKRVRQASTVSSILSMS